MTEQAKQCDKVANWYDNIGKLVWQQIVMSTQCSRFMASQFARQLGNYNNFMGGINEHFDWLTWGLLYIC